VTASEPNRVYHAGLVLRVGTPLLAVLTAAATTAGIQAALPIDAFWVPVVAAAGGVGIACILLLWRRATSMQLEVFDDWFRVTRPDTTLIARWGDIVEVYSPTSRRRRLLGRHEYHVVLGGGISLRLGSEVGADAFLGNEIERRTRTAITGRADSKITDGIPVDFGPITVSADGIQVRAVGTKEIPFDRIRSHKLTGRHYLIRSLDGRRTHAVRVSRIPSPGSLHDLIERRMESSRAARVPAARF
jgi:hypothetical protein